MINGFVVIDKPAGITSHDAVSRVRRILSTRKVGHTGTLDPFATGVLPIAVNDGTKAIPFLDEGTKCYEAVMQLGVTTDTLDMTGKVLSHSDCSLLTPELIRAAMFRFVGQINQVPPMYSAIKRDGQPLYKLARQGQVVERKPRQVDINSLEILKFEAPLVTFKVSCSRGTYIRTLADDIGSELGCGAALKELRRLSSGPFDIVDSVSLEGLEEAAHSGCLDECSVSVEKALEKIPDISLTEAGAERIRHGRLPSCDGTDAGEIPDLCRGDLVRFSFNGKLAAVAVCEGDSEAVKKMVLKRVFA